MICCYGIMPRKYRKKNTIVKPLSDINTMHVYENKKQIRTIYPNNPTNTIEYDKNGIQMN